MRTVNIFFHAVYIKQNSIIVTIRCVNCLQEIDFEVTFGSMDDVPVFASVEKCPICQGYFVDTEKNCYAIAPYPGRTVERWISAAEDYGQRKKKMCDRIGYDPEARACFRAEERKLDNWPVKPKSEKAAKKRREPKWFDQSGDYYAS